MIKIKLKKHISANVGVKMVTENTIKEIETYLSLNPLTNQPKGKLQPAMQRGGMHLMAAPIGIVSSTISTTITLNVRMLETVLSHCSDEQLDELMAECGDDSNLGKIIRKKRAAQYQSLVCSTDRVAKDLEAVIKTKMGDNSFYKSVCYYMNQIGFDNDSDFYNSINMPRQLFAKIRNPKNTMSKTTVLWIIVGLKVKYNEANDLLRKAGYSFRTSDLRDVVLSYVFRNAEYDLVGVNEILQHFKLAPFC